jgi:hypothetical protein
MPHRAGLSEHQLAVGVGVRVERYPGRRAGQRPCQAILALAERHQLRQPSWPGPNPPPRPASSPCCDTQLTLDGSSMSNAAPAAWLIEATVRVSSR